MAAASCQGRCCLRPLPEKQTEYRRSQMAEVFAQTVAESATFSWWSQAFNNGFWVFVGIVAGTLVNLLSVIIIVTVKKKKIKRNIKFEISLNISKIQEWKRMLDQVLQASNSDIIGDCYVLFDFQKIILWTINKTITDGTVYDYIDQESIVTLQKFSDFGTTFYSERINDAIQNFKKSPDRAGAAKMVSFWKSLLDQHESGLRLIESKL